MCVYKRKQKIQNYIWEDITNRLRKNDWKSVKIVSIWTTVNKAIRNKKSKSHSF